MEGYLMNKIANAILRIAASLETIIQMIKEDQAENKKRWENENITE
jgi:hypothetical protein|tara:strand:+ start:74 stop:211 length:138 start_codon:yes stop_codon:yes gene_type:complete